MYCTRRRTTYKKRFYMKTEAFLCLRNILIWREINVFSYWKFLSLIVSSDVTACLLYWLTVVHFDFMFYVVNKVVTANTETMWCLHLLILSHLNKVELNVKSSSHKLELKPKKQTTATFALKVNVQKWSGKILIQAAIVMLFGRIWVTRGTLARMKVKY